jgi:Domain of unknown function (DUF4365)
LLTRNHRQEALSRAYVQAIAACCGMSVSIPQHDYGIDMILNEIEISNRVRRESGRRIDVQAKATTRAQATGNLIRFDLDVRSYDLLRQPTPGNMRILVVLLLPADERNWCAQSEKELVLRRCAYWFSLEGQPPCRHRRSVRVFLPRANLFSADALSALINRMKPGENP